jgi:hypothetical protein
MSEIGRIPDSLLRGRKRPSSFRRPMQRSLTFNPVGSRFLTDGAESRLGTVRAGVILNLKG